MKIVGSELFHDGNTPQWQEDDVHGDVYFETICVENQNDFPIEEHEGDNTQ